MLSAGSVWRRWELHVHTPETILNNQFGDWEEYLKAVEAHPDVKVLRVTFRIAPPTEKATAINIHLLVSPDDPHHEQEILNALARLDWRRAQANRR